VRGVESRRSFLNVEIGKARVLSAVVRACMSLVILRGSIPWVIAGKPVRSLAAIATGFLVSKASW